MSRVHATGARSAGLLLTAAGLLAAGLVSPPGEAPPRRPRRPPPPPPVKHVFVVNLENKGYDETFGPGLAGAVPSKTLRAQGQLLTQYYGTAHNSLPNYIAQISGQGPNAADPGRLPDLLRLRADRHRRAAARRSATAASTRRGEDRRRPARGARA